jgi:hypothetical protein
LKGRTAWGDIAAEKVAELIKATRVDTVYGLVGLMDRAVDEQEQVVEVSPADRIRPA